MSILKGFLSAMANTVDPTWQTPWLLPGPLTPFGILAKLLNEDKDDDNQGPLDEQKKLPMAPCIDKIGQQSKFFENYLQQYGDMKSENPANDGTMPLIAEFLKNSNISGTGINIISPDLIDTLVNQYQPDDEDEEDS